MHPLTPKPLKLGMLCFWHMEWGKEKRKFVFFGTYVLFWYTLEKWRQKVIEIDIKLKEIA
jgi:hypothetical protein